MLTLEEWLRLPEDPDGIRTEVCDGELVMAPSANLGHFDAVWELTARLKAHLPSRLFHVYGDVDVILQRKPLKVRRPDVSVVTSNSKRKPTHKLHASEVLLAVEVLSPNNRTVDREDKWEEYAEAGVPEYWIVDIDTPLLEVWRLGAGPSYRKVQTVTDCADLPLLGHTIPIDLAALAPPLN